MALTSRSRSWSFAVADDEHTVEARIQTRGLTITLTISMDGNVQVQKQASGLEALWGDYPLDVEHCTCVVRAFHKGVVGVATDFQLRVEGQLVAEGEHPTIEPRAPRPSQPESAAAETHPQTAPAPQGGTVPTIPVLPPKCSTCGGSLAMDEVRWVGPLTAKCPYCGTTVPIEWRRIGE
jgi:hypothetical protein